MALIGDSDEISVPCRIMHVVGSRLNEGAALGAYALHRGLLDIGVESRVLLTYPDPEAINADAIADTRRVALVARIRGRLDRLPFDIYWRRRRNPFSTGFAGFEISKHPSYATADIVHLYWINSGMVAFHTLKHITKPIVWALRDM